MRIGTMFNKKLPQMSMPKANAKAPTNTRKTVPGPRIEPTNKTACEVKSLST